MSFLLKISEVIYAVSFFVLWVFFSKSVSFWSEFFCVMSFFLKISEFLQWVFLCCEFFSQSQWVFQFWGYILGFINFLTALILLWGFKTHDDFSQQNSLTYFNNSLTKTHDKKTHDKISKVSQIFKSANLKKVGFCPQRAARRSNTYSLVQSLKTNKTKHARAGFFPFFFMLYLARACLNSKQLGSNWGEVFFPLFKTLSMICIPLFWGDPTNPTRG